MLRKNIFSSRGFHVLNNQRSTRGLTDDPSRIINVQPSTTMNEESGAFNDDVPTTTMEDNNALG